MTMGVFAIFTSFVSNEIEVSPSFDGNVSISRVTFDSGKTLSFPGQSTTIATGWHFYHRNRVKMCSCSM